MNHSDHCPLCTRDRQSEVWSDGLLRVIDANEQEFPGFTRVVWHKHVQEMTDLDAAERLHLMATVWTVERVMRKQLSPDKINLAQFGNMVPHIHWHVIPRWTIDSRFPDAIWAPAKNRTPETMQTWTRCCSHVRTLIPDYHDAVRKALDSR